MSIWESLKSQLYGIRAHLSRKDSASRPEFWLQSQRPLALLMLLAILFQPASAFQQLATPSSAMHPITGRKYANVMGMGGADWLVRPEREAEENVDGALDALKIQPGMAVAEIGAGVGYVTMKISKRVGVTGKVFANDIQPAMLSRLKENTTLAGIRNVTLVLGEIDDPKLPPDRMDLIILVDVYHEFSQPQKMLRGIRSALKSDGRLVLLEYRKEDPKVPILEDHKMSVAEVKAEVEPEGFRLRETIEKLPRQHILVFTKAVN
jgi:SAM-dependent methyltransferase